MVAGGGQAQALQVTVMRVSNHSMQADFLLEDPAADCFFATTSVLFVESMTRTNGVPADQPPTVVVDIAYSDTCTGDSFVLSGSAAQPAVSIRRDLSLATLSAQVPVSDGNGLTVTANVNLVFTANGPLQKAQSSFRSHDAGTIFIEKTRAETRTAVATGSISVVLPLSAGAATVELAPQGSEDASIGKNSDGTVTIITR
jgi:hypothetical protein